MHVEAPRESAAVVTVSIVSHGHGAMVGDVLRDLAASAQVARVVLTLNVAECVPEIPAALADKMVVVRNHVPAGFARNHNAAFRHCDTDYFCVLNPDVRFGRSPFDALIASLRDARVGMAAPAVRGPEGGVEDSARFFPTVPSLLAKLLGRGDGRVPVEGADPQPVDWAAGMFHLYRSEVFRRVGGFDEGFHLYYEDVDLCARLWKAGFSVLLHPGVSVVHHAQRDSRRKPRYFLWHVTSMLRYFAKHMGRLPRRGAHDSGRRA